jgi:hypothetical protein
MKEGNCRLCARHGELRDSHVIAKAFVKRYNRTSPTGAARNVVEPNRRTQAYLHKPLLCPACEERFEKRETIWARDVDQKVNEPLPRSFTCSEEHRYFAASLIWRIIVWGDTESEKAPFTDDDRERISEVEKTLRAYLLGNAPYPVPPWPWLHLVTPPHGFTGADAPQGINVYLQGSLDIALNGFGDALYCYALIGGYLVVGILAIGEALITWTLGTELRPTSVVVQDPLRFPIDPNFLGLLAGRAAALHRVPLSVKQQGIVNERVESVPRADLRTNPHIIATLVDYQNAKQRAQNEGQSN